tara:strand:- start:582 stop:1175 length:594 start_codon:yes stop_codon:yes gene_type:complete
MYILVLCLWTLVTFNIYLLAGSCELYIINPPWGWIKDGIQLFALHTNGYFLVCLILNLLKKPLGGLPNLTAQFTYQILYGTEFGWDCFVTSMILENLKSRQSRDLDKNATGSEIIFNFLQKTSLYVICFHLIGALNLPLEPILNNLFPHSALSLIHESIWEYLFSSLPREFIEILSAVLIGYCLRLFRKSLIGEEIY